jgi:protein CpxP
MIFQSRAPATRAVTAATILGLALIAAPSAARASDLAPGARTGLPLVLAQYAAAPAKQNTASAKPAATDRIEARIKDLHDKLHITQAQSVQWESVAQTMRANGVMMSDSIKERSAKTKSMTAMDDLRSYQRVAQAHTDGLNQFVPAFAALYDGMSAEQKKNADLVFAQFQRHSPAAEKSKTTSKIN